MSKLEIALTSYVIASQLIVIYLLKSRPAFEIPHEVEAPARDSEFMPYVTHATYPMPPSKSGKRRLIVNANREGVVLSAQEVTLA